MAALRCVEMDAMEEYSELLRSCGRNVRMYTEDKNSMKATNMKAKRHISFICMKQKTITRDAVFNEGVVNLTDIHDDGKYYVGVPFFPCVEAQYIKLSRSICAADASHCVGVGLQLYGVTFEIITYDTGMHVLYLMLAQFEGEEFHDYKQRVFAEYKQI